MKSIRFEPNKIVICTSIGTITLNVRWLRRLLAEYDQEEERQRRKWEERKGA